MFGIGGNELIIIVIFALLVFGPDKLPEIGRTIGRAMRQFQKAQDDMKRIINMEMYARDDDKENSPFRGVKSLLDPDYWKGEEKVIGPTEVEQPSEEAPATTPPATSSIAASLYDLPAETTPELAPEPAPASPVDSAPAPSTPPEPVAPAPMQSSVAPPPPATPSPELEPAPAPEPVSGASTEGGTGL